MSMPIRSKYNPTSSFQLTLAFTLFVVYNHQENYNLAIYK